LEPWPGKEEETGRRTKPEEETGKPRRSRLQLTTSSRSSKPSSGANRFSSGPKTNRLSRLNREAGRQLQPLGLLHCLLHWLRHSHLQAQRKLQALHLLAQLLQL
jgi:hypothetical protein